MEGLCSLDLSTEPRSFLGSHPLLQVPVSLPSLLLQQLLQLIDSLPLTQTPAGSCYSSRRDAISSAPLARAAPQLEPPHNTLGNRQALLYKNC